MSVLDEESLRNLESVVENRKFRPKTEKPRSNVKTIQSELPQRTFSINFNRRSRKRDQDITPKTSQVDLDKMSPKLSPKLCNKTNGDTLFPFPPRSASPTPLPRSASPKHSKGSSSTFKISKQSSTTNVNLDVEEEDSREIRSSK